MKHPRFPFGGAFALAGLRAVLTLGVIGSCSLRAVPVLAVDINDLDAWIVSIRTTVKTGNGIFSPFSPFFPQKYPVQLPLRAVAKQGTISAPLAVSLPEDEEYGAAEAERGPDEVEAEFLAHEEQGERHEDGERDDFLKDLELGERERGVADAVRRHLKQILEQGDPPADDGGQPPRLARHVFEVPVPGERHEAVRADQQKDRAVNGGDGNDCFNKFMHDVFLKNAGWRCPANVLM